MTVKGLQLSDVAKEINTKLHRMLPSGFFCAAALIELDSESRKLSVWNGGLPHLLLYQADENKVRHKFDSIHLSLGILPTGSFDASLEHVAVSSLDSLIAYSDGVVECENPAGELYGDHRLIESLRTRPTDLSPFHAITRDLKIFRGQAAQLDDYTLIDLPCGLGDQKGQ